MAITTKLLPRSNVQVGRDWPCQLRASPTPLAWTTIFIRVAKPKVTLDLEAEWLVCSSRLRLLATHLLLVLVIDIFHLLQTHPLGRLKVEGFLHG